jgi:FkbM family methyltransferase
MGADMNEQREGIAGSLRAGLGFYRRSVRHAMPLHAAAKAITRLTILPILEKSADFSTVPTDPVWLRTMLLAGAYEPATVAWVKRLVTKGMTVCDVGAHVGYFTRRLAHLVGHEGLVIAFEPQPETVSFLRKNTQRFPNVVVVEAALDDKDGTGLLANERGDSTTFRLDDASQGQEQPGRMAKATPRTVRTLRFDDWAESNGVEQLDFVKIDAEGADIRVLNGMRKTLQRSMSIRAIVECAPAVLESAGTSASQLMELLADLFDDVSVIVGRTELLPSHAHDVVRIAETSGYVNLLCCRGSEDVTRFGLTPIPI